MALERFDAALGNGMESAMIRHHIRRLKRKGQLRAIAPATEGLWAETATPPRLGNSFEVLVDGAHALPLMAEAIRGARRHVHVCSWNLEPGFDPGPRKSAPVRELLGEVAERVPVRVLVWAGAPVPVFKPRRGDVRAAREELVRGTKIQCELDARGRAMHCHHEKIVIVDDEVAFVGGIDLTALAGDRYDSCEHPLREGIGWHDASTRLRGPIVARRRGAFRAALGGGRRRRARAPRRDRRRPATPPPSSSARSPSARIRSSRVASSRCSRPTCGRCAARAH